MSTARFLGLSCLVLALAGRAAASTFTWDGAPDGGGSSADTLVTTGTNWVGDVAPDIGTAPGQDWVFDNSAVTTIVGTPAGGGRVNSITFSNNAPAFTFTDPVSPGTDWAFPNIVNNSPNLQTLNVGLNVQGVTIRSAGGPISVGGEYLYNNGTQNDANSARFLLTKDITLNAPMWRRGNVNVYGPNGTSTTVADMAGVTGALIINAATGTANSNSNGNWVGKADIWSGALRVGNSAALGYGGSNSAFTYIHGTFATANATVGQSAGGFDHAFGRLEVYNNVTLNERIRIDSRIGDAADFDHIVNVSGNNTVGPISAVAGGGHFNFRSDSGTMTITTDIDTRLHTSDPGQSGGAVVNSVYTFRGAGNIILANSLTKADAGFGTEVLRKQGAGTLTLQGAANGWQGGTLVEGGTLAATASFGTAGTYTHVAGGATLDLSAISGLTLASGKILSGSGSVVGPVTVAGLLSPGGVGSLDGSDLLTVANSVGTLSISSLVFNNGASFDFQLNPTDTTTGANVNDLIGVSGLLDASAATANTLTLNVQNAGGGNFTGLGTWTLMSFGSVNPGTFDPSQINITGLAPGLSGSIGVNGNGTVTLTTVVPEPSTVGLAALAALGLGLCIRRRK